MQAGSTYHVGEDSLLVLDVADSPRELQKLLGQFHNECRMQLAQHHQLRAQHPGREETERAQTMGSSRAEGGPTLHPPQMSLSSD